jgi:hypothetical protein
MTGMAMAQSAALQALTKSTRLTGGNSTAAIAGDGNAGLPMRCGYEDWIQENKTNQLMVAPPLFGRWSPLRRTLLRWCTNTTNRFDATVQNKTPTRALQVRDITLIQMDSLMRSIRDRSEHTVTDLGELLRKGTSQFDPLQAPLDA